LSAHFSALAERYVAEAARHTSMSRSFVGNPSRNLGTGLSVHCTRLADLNTQSATTLRDLATDTGVGCRRNAASRGRPLRSGCRGASADGPGTQ
jgi:hypothetical protein